MTKAQIHFLYFFIILFLKIFDFLFGFRKMFIDKVKFFLDGIIGHPYGSTFEVKDGEMVKIDRAETEKATKCKYHNELCP